MDTNTKELTLGESRVRTTFNPSNDGYVDKIKQDAAALINTINSAAAKPNLSDKQLGEFVRLKSLAMTAIEEGAMWAVKVATF